MPHKCCIAVGYMFDDSCSTTLSPVILTVITH